VKTLYLLRHAEADDGPLDRERGLTVRGRGHAESLGRWMSAEGILPARIISSSAKRAKATAEICSEIAGYQRRIRFDDGLYDAHGAAYIDIVTGLDNKYDSVMIVGHNPAVSDATAIFAGNRLNATPCSLVCIEFAVKEWHALQNSRGILNWAWSPDY
jgi:phosphohistidine phosphatase